jgi:aryl-alcohol dehydrogenase-like predicted oxidoreductase
MEPGRSDAIQLVFNLLNWKPVKELFPLAKEKGVGIIAREPLHNGFLTGKYSKGVTFPKGDIRAPWPSDYIATLLKAAESIRYLANEKRTLAQAALKFVLGSDAVSVVIPGCKTEAQVQENMGASDCEDLTQAEVDRMIRTFFVKVE